MHRRSRGSGGALRRGRRGGKREGERRGRRGRGGRGKRGGEEEEERRSRIITNRDIMVRERTLKADTLNGGGTLQKGRVLRMHD